MGNARFFISPADIEPSVLAVVNNGGLDWHLLPVEATRTLEAAEEGAKPRREKYNPCQEFLNALNPGDEIFAPLGGTGDAFLVGAYQRGATIRRISFFDLRHQPRGDVKVPGSLVGKKADGEDQVAVKAQSKLVERCQRTAQMIYLAGQPETRDLFRDFRAVDLRVAMIRVLIMRLVAIQDRIRKPLQQQTTRLERDSAYILQPGTPSAAALDLRIEMIESSPPLESLLDFEERLSKRIEVQLRHLRVWNEVLAPVRGIGPRLAARIVAPVVDIRRFPTRPKFWKYAGWHTMLVNGHRVAARFLRGESGQFHELLRQGAWLFAEQLVRSDSQFRWFYDRYKASARAAQIGEVVFTDERGKERRMNKAWFDRRARRYAAQKFLTYLFYGWWKVEGRTFANTKGETIDPARFLAPETLPYAY